MRSRAWPASFAAAVSSPAEKNTASPALTPAFAAMAAWTSAGMNLAIGPFPTIAPFSSSKIT